MKVNRLLRVSFMLIVCGTVFAQILSVQILRAATIQSYNNSYLGSQSLVASSLPSSHYRRQYEMNQQSVMEVNRRNQMLQQEVLKQADDMSPMRKNTLIC